MQVALRGRDEQPVAPMLDVRGLVVEFSGDRGARRAVDGVNFAVERGETFALVGPAAAGKTALLRAIAGLEVPAAGTIAIEGMPPAQARSRTVALVTEAPGPWPRVTVAEAVALPIEGRGLTNAAVRAKVAEALAKAGLGQSAELAVKQLSGGQQQRLALACALIEDPKLLLLDDALSRLDADAREEIRGEVKSLGKTTLFVTHDQEGALAMAGRIAVMRAGRIVECGAPLDLYLSPRHPFTAHFLGHAVLIEGRRVAGMGEGVLVETDIGSFVAAQAVHDSAAGYLMIRPEFVEMVGHDVSASNLVHGTVRGVSFTGKLMEYAVEAGPRMLRVQRPATRLYTEGEPVRLRLPAERCSFLPRDD